MWTVALLSRSHPSASQWWTSRWVSIVPMGASHLRFPSTLGSAGARQHTWSCQPSWWGDAEWPRSPGLQPGVRGGHRRAVQAPEATGFNSELCDTSRCAAGGSTGCGNNKPCRIRPVSSRGARTHLSQTIWKLQCCWI